MNQTDRPIANPNVVLREEFDDWAVLYNPDTAGAFGINPVGVAVWKLMDSKKTIEGIVFEIKNFFEETPDSIFNEITTFINTLVENDFVELPLKSE